MLSYPTNPKDANLRVIDTLKKTFPSVRVGFSDHVAPDDNMMTLAAAYLLGAEVIEKHFTLDKTLPGNDHYHAGDPEDFKKAIANFQWIDKILGNPEKVVLVVSRFLVARLSLIGAYSLHESRRDYQKGRPYAKASGHWYRSMF